MKAGFAKRVINPELGMKMEGLAQKGGIRSVHDNLFVRTFKSGTVKRKTLMGTRYADAVRQAPY